MHGCCLGSDSAGPGLGNIPWGYLGQDGSDDSSFVGPQEPPGTVAVDASGNFLDANGNVLNADGSINYSATTAEQATTVSNVTAGQLQAVANGGSTGNPATDANIAALISASGSAAQAVLKQIQLGQIASSTPLGNTALQAAIVGGGFNTSGLQSALSSLTSNPTLLLGGLLVVGLMLFRKR